MSEETKKEDNKAAWSGLDASRVARIKELENKVADLEPLVDGAYEIIEIWKAESPAQIAWKKAWLAKARANGLG